MPKTLLSMWMPPFTRWFGLSGTSRRLLARSGRRGGGGRSPDALYSDHRCCCSQPRPAPRGPLPSFLYFPLVLFPHRCTRFTEVVRTSWHFFLESAVERNDLFFHFVFSHPCKEMCQTLFHPCPRTVFVHVDVIVTQEC